MEKLLVLLPDWVQVISVALSSIMILATVIVRLTPSKEDDTKVAKIASMVFKIISYLPTLGMNPNTKKLKEYYDEMHKVDEAKS